MSIISKPCVNSNWSYSPETFNSGKNRRFFVPCDLEIWRMTLKNNKAPVLHCSSLVHHFIAISEFKLELQSGNTQYGSKWVFLSRVTLKFDRWPWKTIDQLFYATPSVMHHFVAIGQWIQTEVAVRKRPVWVINDDLLVVWPWNLTNNLKKKPRAPLLSNIKLCASFHYHMLIQTGVTVRKPLSWETAKLGPLWPWPLTSDLDILHGPHFLPSVITPENFTMIRWGEYSEKAVTDRQTDRQTDRLDIHRADWSQLKLNIKSYKEGGADELWYSMSMQMFISDDITTSIGDVPPAVTTGAQQYHW